MGLDRSARGTADRAFRRAGRGRRGGDRRRWRTRAARTAPARCSRPSDPDEGEAFAAARRAAFPALEKKGSLLLEDVGVALPALPALVRGIEKIAEKHEVVIAVVAHAGDGNTHPLVVYNAADADETQARVRRVRRGHGPRARVRRDDHRRARRRPAEEGLAAGLPRRGRDGADPDASRTRSTRRASSTRAPSSDPASPPLWLLRGRNRDQRGGEAEYSGVVTVALLVVAAVLAVVDWVAVARSLAPRRVRRETADPRRADRRGARPPTCPTSRAGSSPRSCSGCSATSG